MEYENEKLLKLIFPNGVPGKFIWGNFIDLPKINSILFLLCRTPSGSSGTIDANL